MFRFHEANAVHVEEHFRAIKDYWVNVPYLPREGYVHVKGPLVGRKTRVKKIADELVVNGFQGGKARTAGFRPHPPKLLPAVGKTTSTVKPDLKRRRIDITNNRTETGEPFFGNFPYEGQRQVQVFRPGETPTRTLRTELLLDFKYPAFEFIARFYGNKKAHFSFMHNGR
jgi:hypothetical protein